MNRSIQSFMLGVPRTDGGRQATESIVDTQYEDDFHAWAMQQAARVRAVKVEGLDVENIAEELETLGRAERREIQSRLEVLLLHLIKLRFQPHMRSGSWQASVMLQHSKLMDVLDDNPSLRALPEQKLEEAYARACLKAEIETGLTADTFPKSCPFSITDIMDPAFFG